MNTEEQKDIQRLVQKLNNNTFKPELFDYNVLREKDYLRFVLLLRDYDGAVDERLFARTNTEKVRKLKTNVEDIVTHKDVMLCSFFKRLGVL